MTEILNAIEKWLALYGLQVVGAIVILVVGLIAARLIAGLARRIMKRAQVEATLISFGRSVIHFILVAVVILAALNQVGFQTTSLIAVLGAAALAVGLALRGHLSNLAAGVIILVSRPFRINDFIEVAGAEGTVEAISLLTTRIKTADGKTVFLPNAKAVTEKLTNFSLRPVRRIDLVIGIGYEQDIDRAKQVARAVVESDPRVVADPALRVDVLDLADSSVNLAVRPWVRRQDYWDARVEILERLKKAFDQAGVSIPFPQREVILHYRRTAEGS
jgi:small conductance mechanosensitive channel